MRQKVLTNGVIIKDSDSLSYSAGTTGTSPYSFRFIQRNGNIFEALASKMPHHILARLMGNDPPLVINCYPATLFSSSVGVFVDTYLSTQVFTKAMRMAAENDLPVIVIGQPLFLMSAIINYISAGFKLPSHLVVSSGGYYLPQSAEATLRTHAAQCGSEIFFLHLYGIAEVDSGLLVATHRNQEGEPVYFPRDGRVVFTVRDGFLVVSLKDSQGLVYLNSFETGDRAHVEADGGIIIGNPARLSREVRQVLESWTPEDWGRRTGFIGYGKSGDMIFQLRQKATVIQHNECDYFEFQRNYGTGNFLDKPKWSNLDLT